tara:strand:- start:11651 stop:13822 length:2172 start_codon:yes stop_codon:yes gene_type:complete
MSYRRVLDNLTQGEEANVTRAGKYNQDWVSDERKRDLAQLDAIKGFSQKLDQFVQEKYKRDDAQLQADMELKVAEEHLEAKEQTGDANISEEENIQYIKNKEDILINEKDLAKAANSALEKGASFQEAKQIHNLSGAALYYYVRAKSKIAADNYEDWIAGEMKKNNTLELEANGVEFTPQTAETLDQKKIAMKALRREYMRQNDLASVNPALLNDDDVGFYDKAIQSHDKLYKEYEKDDAIKTGINDRLEAANQFKIDKDFEALFGKIKITAKENGDGHSYKDVLDETFEVLKDSVLNGDIEFEDLEEIKNQKITVDGKQTTVGRWKTRWRELETELATEEKNRTQARLDKFIAAKKDIEADWKELEVSSEDPISDEDKAKFIKRWTDETGEENPPAWMNDYLTAEDNNDTDTLEFHLDQSAGGRGYLIEADLFGMSKAVKKKYKGDIKKSEDILKDNAFQKKAERSIKASLTTILEVSADDSTAEYDNALTNAEADYENEYLAALTYTEPEQAHKIAIQAVKDKFAGKDGKIDKNDRYRSPYFKQKRVNKEKIKQQVKENREVVRFLEKGAADLEDDENLLDFVKNNKLPYVDEHLELARNYKKDGSKKVPDYFKRIARKVPYLEGWDIMDAQLKLDQKLKGEKQDGAGDRPLDNEVLKDESLKDVNRKLTYKSNQFSIHQAGIDLLDTKQYLDSTDEYSVFKSMYNTDQNLMMPGINLSGV